MSAAAAPGAIVSTLEQAVLSGQMFCRAVRSTEQLWLRTAARHCSACALAAASSQVQLLSSRTVRSCCAARQLVGWPRPHSTSCTQTAVEMRSSKDRSSVTRAPVSAAVEVASDPRPPHAIAQAPAMAKPVIPMSRCMAELLRQHRASLRPSAASHPRALEPDQKLPQALLWQTFVPPQGIVTHCPF